MMFTSDLKVKAPFKDLFPIRGNILNEIVRDMKKNGFDHTRPIVLWQGHNCTVLDGHTRLRAAELTDTLEVPVEVKSFPTEDEALEYVIKCQRNRRNLSDQEILQCVSELDKRRDRTLNFEAKTSKATHVALGKSANETAEVLGIGRGKVEKARAVLDKAPDEIREAVKSGEMSINRAYNQTVNPPQGSPESLDRAAEEIGNVEKVFDIVKKRLSREQIKELIGLLQQAV
ncbi:MAG: ParB/RepB/Spo0J family partition protein [Victivallaceae bacterium]|nr:ParB/RepB/Spo0J family partition protein [Victivallaceae bacterium]